MTATVEVGTRWLNHKSGAVSTASRQFWSPSRGRFLILMVRDNGTHRAIPAERILSHYTQADRGFDLPTSGSVYLADGTERALRPRHVAYLRKHVPADLSLDACWPWSGVLTDDGYARCSIDHRNYAAHRVFYSLIRGKIAAGLHLDHLCRVRHCVNPEHLDAITGPENTRRALAARRPALPLPYPHVPQ